MIPSSTNTVDVSYNDPL